MSGSVWETTGRTNTETDRFFLEHIPVRIWRTHVFHPLDENLKGGSEEMIKVSHEELEKV